MNRSQFSVFSFQKVLAFYLLLGTYNLLLSSFAQESLTLRLGELLHPTPPLAITGINDGLMMNVIDTRDAFAELNLQAYRFPPGNVADEQELGQLVLRSYKQHLKLLGTQPVMMVANLFTGTPEQAAEAARYVIENDIPILTWEIGNEPDLYAPNRDDDSWTPAKYCEHFRAYREAILEVNSKFTFAGPAVSGADIAEPYLREFLKLCGDVVDVLTWHIYPSDGSISDEAALASSSLITETIRRYRAWTKDPEFNPLGYERDIKLGITEFGLSWRTNTYRHLQDIVATVWLADALGQMLAENLDMSFYFALQGVGGHGLIDNALWQRPTYDVFERLTAFEGDVLSVSGATDDVHVYAVQTSEGLEMMLVNLSSKDALVKVEGLESTLTISTLPRADYEPYFDEPSYSVSEQAASEAIQVPAVSVIFISTN